MSLAALKHIFFRQKLVPALSPKTSRSSLLSHSDSSDASDLESQASTANSARKSFKIEARFLSDATIGLSDGLTVPFALTAGLSALGNTNVVIYGGLAELIAGAISMGLGGYLGAKSEQESYQAQREQTQERVLSAPGVAEADIEEVFEPYNLPKETMDDLTRHLTKSPKLVDFIMQFQNCAEEPAPSRALISALTISMAYFLGGLLPLIPYFAVSPTQVYEGLYISIAVMVVALFTFGYSKTCIVTGWRGSRNVRRGCFGGVQMVVVGSAAAGAAMGLVRAFNHDEDGYRVGFGAFGSIGGDPGTGYFDANDQQRVGRVL